jgi:hypothetical protein
VKDTSAVKISIREIRTEDVAGPLAFPSLDPLPVNLVDNCKIRMGSWTPAFPITRAK